MPAQLRRAALIFLLDLPSPVVRTVAGRPAEIAGQQLDLKLQWLCKLAASVMAVEGSYDTPTLDDPGNALPRRAIGKAFLKTHPDNYDFLR